MDQALTFRKSVSRVAVPVTVQSLLQSSFSTADQVMCGQLGTVAIAGIGLGGKFASVFSVCLNAIGAVAGIMIAQYVGQRKDQEVSRSFFVNGAFAGLLAVLFAWGCILFPEKIVGLYTEDMATLKVGAAYLRIFSLSFLPAAGMGMLSALLRCVERAQLPLYASGLSAVLNTALNYGLIFGRLGLPALGVRGAAWASVISQLAGCIFMLGLFAWSYPRSGLRLRPVFGFTAAGWRQYGAIALPVLLCEFLWSFGENVYAAIYGRMGTADCAAMTLTAPVQGLFMGALSGVASAAGVLIGKRLGQGETEAAYREGKRLQLLGFGGSLLLSLVLVGTSRWYAGIFQVEPEVRLRAIHILWVFAAFAPVKVLNMILGGGILRSGGKTKYVMLIDIIGTWCFGVPLGLLAAGVWHLPVALVYGCLSMEEAVRLGISLAVFRRKRWMQKLEGQ